MSGNNAYFTTSPAMLMKRWQALNVSPSVTPSISVTPSNTPEPVPTGIPGSPSVTPTPTVTPTITPTPSVITYTVDLYARYGDDPFFEDTKASQLVYNVNGGGDIVINNFGDLGIDGSCQYITTITVNNLDTFQYGCKRDDGTPITYDIDTDTGGNDCPSNSQIYCGTVDTSGGYYDYGAVTANIIIYMTIYVDSGNFANC